MGNNEVITGADYKRMIIGAYSEFILEYEKINRLKKKAGFSIAVSLGQMYCGLWELRYCLWQILSMKVLAAWHGGWQMQLCWGPEVMEG